MCVTPILSRTKYLLLDVIKIDTYLAAGSFPLPSVVGQVAKVILAYPLLTKKKFVSGTINCAEHESWGGVVISEVSPIPHTVH